MPIEKSERRISAEEFLREARELIADERVFLLPREANTQWIKELEITAEQAYEEIARLTINNYCNGPEEDWDRSGTFLWIFGGTIEKKETYIKLKIEEHPQGRILKCISFHEARSSLKYPLRPTFQMRE